MRATASCIPSEIDQEKARIWRALQTSQTMRAIASCTPIKIDQKKSGTCNRIIEKPCTMEAKAKAPRRARTIAASIVMRSRAEAGNLCRKFGETDEEAKVEAVLESLL